MKKMVLEVYNRIVELNGLVDNRAIPHSDVFLRETISMLGVELPELKQIISILKDAHYILSIEITKEDRKNEIKRVEGYVDANLPNIRALKNYFQKTLMDQYEKEYHNRLMVHQIMKEIYSRGAIFMNTPLGQVANKAIMLEEYENLIEKEFQEFTETWKDSKLNEILAIYEDEKIRKNKESTDSDGASVFKKESGIPRANRAVDTKEYISLAGGENRSMKKMINIYGVEFFFRVNLRNCNFANIATAIENKEIDRRSDLRMLKDMIHNMKMNMDREPRCPENADQLRALERLVSRSS